MFKSTISLVALFSVLWLSRSACAMEIHNEFISLKIDETTSLAQVTDLKTGTVYEQIPSFEVAKLEGVTVTPQSGGLHVSYSSGTMPLSLTYKLAPDAPVLDVTLEMDPEQKVELLKFLVPFTVSGRGFEWVTPDGYGLLHKVDDATDTQINPCLEWAGLFHPRTGEGYTLINNDYHHGGLNLRVKPLAGRPTLVPELAFGGFLGKFQEPRSVRFIFQQTGGYVTMALNFRKHLMEHGHYRSLADKQRDNPAMAKLNGAPLFWIYPNASGADPVLKVMDDMIASGMDRGIVGLGFNFYINPEGAKRIQEKFSGGIVGIYDNYFDLMSKEWFEANGYPKVAVDWMERYKRFGRIPEHVALNQSGELNAVPGPNGNRYVGSPPMSFEAAKERLAAEEADYKFVYRFFDVTPGAALWLDQDFNPLHPATPKQSMEARLRVFKLFYDAGMILGGEGGDAWATPYFTISEGAMSIKHMTGRLEPVAPDENFKLYNMAHRRRVPTNGIVYGDARVATWAWGDNYVVQPDYMLKKDLFNILYGTMPSYHVSTDTYWKNKAKILESYNRVIPVYEKLYGAALVNHRWLNESRDVQQSDFSNGWHVVVNFGDTEFVLDERVTVAPMGFHTWQSGR